MLDLGCRIGLAGRAVRLIVTATIFTGLAPAALAQQNGKIPPMPPLRVVPVDPLVKVFRDDDLSDVAGEAHADAARGEHVTFQLVVAGTPIDIYDLQCSATAFVRSDAADAAPAVDPPQVRFVSYVGSSMSMDTTASDQLRPAPAMYPDPLLPKLSGPIHAGENQPLWLSQVVPLETEPGDYIATATVTGEIFGVPTSATVPLRATIYPATVADTRLDVTHWYQMWYHTGKDMPERYSDEWFDIVRGYMRNMRAHRQNWGWIESMAAMKFSRDAAGRLQVDFTNFDRWVQLMLDEGMEKLEGQHYAFRKSGWSGPFGVQIYAPGPDNSAWEPKRVDADSAEAVQFYEEFFPIFQAHLEERGWLDKYWQHVADEPLDVNADSYTTAAMLLKQHAPKMKIMDACQTQKVAGLVDLWVPQLDHFAKGHDFFKERMEQGDTVWFYTCMYPTGEYANRFLELPLIKTRLLHWINFKYGATGYLHWGYNFFPPHVWQDAANYSQARLPGGDACIVYPDPDSFGVFDSIRYEAMRDGIEDHELLSQVAERDEALAQQLAERIVKDFTEYDTDVERFRQTRRDLLEAAGRVAD